MISTKQKLHVIGELMNNSYARARRAFKSRDLEAFQRLAQGQSELGAAFLTLNIDGTQRIQVKLQEMLDFLPTLIPAIQQACDTPISFDNPSIEYHKVALAHYDRSLSGKPILNSLAASRENLDEMIDLVKDYDTKAIVMASEKFVDGGGAQCLNPLDSYEAAKRFVEMLVERADRSTDDIIIDTGLAPVGADTYGLVNIGLDAMQLISNDPDMKGVHMMVGLSNFSFGTPKHMREKLEGAYLTLAMQRGLDFALANPEKSPAPLPPEDPIVAGLQNALDQGRPRDGESQESAGFRQAEAILALCAQQDDDDDWDDWD
ncbi:dihydropteroate synthase [Pelagicoccus sp. SDUM812003]|uniref:dihydropteroate synthase n=1 Tax=Pelagicoccus sp. SDUM812003 TaxID=3041267 RepID=UPI00280E2F9A|nr:dihydropteroate synthase [Pelagicoccus sp. SDUM812003]MDQ8201948.1 dihydropteroate synthase [Pelagicoccus sp. SDUM812003]